MGIFVDKRLDTRYAGLVSAMTRQPSVIIRQLASDRNEEVAFGRFLNNRFVSPQQMIETASHRTAEHSKGRDVLLVCDTSTMGFGMNSPIKGLAQTGDGSGRGFFLHPVISVDANQGHCLGLASAKLYDRKERKASAAQRRRDRNREPLSQKESFRWYEEVERAVKRDQGASSHTVVADREADIYELLVLLTALKVDFVIRSFQNRRIQQASTPNLLEALAAQDVQWKYQLDLPATDKRSAHTADLEVKWIKTQLARPRSGTGTKHLVKQQEVSVVEVAESPSSVVGKEKPIYWRLLTSHQINSTEDALRIVRYYIQRWSIEQVFRVLKKKGLNIQSAEVKSEHAIKNLTALALISAVQVMQLVQARDHPHGLKACVGFEPRTVAVINQINTQLEGNTDKLKNPHPPDSMAFAAWVVARLGGWSGYSSQRPPGPITMWNGLRKLFNMIDGLRLLQLYPKTE